MLSKDYFSNLKQHAEKHPFSANCIIKVHIVNIIKGSKFNWCLSHKTLHYAELLQVSLKEDLVYNDYSLFAGEVISKPQYAQESIKSFQFSLVTTLSRGGGRSARLVQPFEKNLDQRITGPTKILEI